MNEQNSNPNWVLIQLKNSMKQCANGNFNGRMVMWIELYHEKPRQSWQYSKECIRSEIFILCCRPIS